MKSLCTAHCGNANFERLPYFYDTLPVPVDIYAELLAANARPVSSRQQHSLLRCLVYMIVYMTLHR